MYKKVTKVALICILVFLIPSNCIAIEDNSFLSTLIQYSYPEVKVIDKNNQKSEESNNNKKLEESDKKQENDKTEGSISEDNQNIYSDKSKSDKENYNEGKDEQFVKVYVGKENIPVAKSKGNSINLEDSSYASNLRITGNNPKILIYHTHSCETYADSPGGNYHSQDKDHSVMSVGCKLTNELSNDGWDVIHSTKYHDIPYETSYYKSGQTIESITSDYNSVKVSIDLHRNGLTIPDEATKKAIEKEGTATIDGKEVAKFFFVVGARNENVAKVKKLADGLTAYAKEKYPDLIMPVVVKPYGKFNQGRCENAILVEVGSNGTTTQEAQNSAKYIADVLDGYFKDKNI